MKAKHVIATGALVAGIASLGLTTHHRIGPPDIYPPSWAIGAVNPEIRTPEQIAATICNAEWRTGSVRPAVGYTDKLKIVQLKQLGFADQYPADYEEDHLISLELGGNPIDPKNLWPEPYKASIPDGGARSKDKVEDYLHAEVCAGRISLRHAQQQIVADWYAVLKSMPQTTESGGGNRPDR